MNIVRNVRTYMLLFTSMTFLLSCTTTSANKIRVFDFKYEPFEFLSGDVLLELPDKSGPLYGRMYYKVLMDQYIDLESGYGEISDLYVNRYKGQRIKGFDSKLIIKRTLEIRNNHNIIFRRAVWYGNTLITFVLSTTWDNTTFPTESERENRIRKDDEIFEHVVNSFRYRKEDGTYAKPEIIRQEEVVKDLR